MRDAGGSDGDPVWLDGPALARVMFRFGEVLEARRAHIDAINVFPVADADTGTNLSHTVGAMTDHLDRSSPLPTMAGTLRDTALLAGRGASGLIFSQAVAGLCAELVDADRADGPRLGEALVAAAASAAHAVVDPVEGTMLTAASRAAAAATSTAALGGAPRAVALAARDAAWEAVVESPALLPKLAEAGVVDSGAVGYAMFLDVLAAELDGGPIPQRDLPKERGPSPPDLPVDRYEVVAELRGASGIDALRDRLAALGAAVAIASDDGFANIHVHCADPRRALTAMAAAGSVVRFEVTDLHTQALAPGGGVVVVVATVEQDVADLIAAGADRLLVASDEGRLLQSLEAMAGGDIGIVTVGDDRDGTEDLARLAGVEATVRSVPSIADAAGAVANLRG